MERVVLKGKSRCNSFHIDDLIGWFSTPNLIYSHAKQSPYKKYETQPLSALEK